MLDRCYISIFNHYKKRLGKRSIKLALVYINLLELSVVIVLAAFFKAFAGQMKMVMMSATKFWVLYGFIVAFVIFKNWMRYNGKKRTILNAKLKTKATSLFILWLLPIASILMAMILLQA